MLILLYIVAGITTYFFLVWGIYSLLQRIQKKVHPERFATHNDQEEWKPHFKLKHKGVQLFHLLFEPHEKEVIYFGEKNATKREQFIEENMNLIVRMFADKGFKFTYLPALRLSKEEIVKYLEYRIPQGLDEQDIADITSKVSNMKFGNDYLYDFMVMPMNRHIVEGGFAWFNYSDTTPTGLPKYVFDYISFDGEEALLQPEEVLKEICEELGRNITWHTALYCSHEREDDDPADMYFDFETRQLLEEVRERVEKLRLIGISEAVINSIIAPKPVLSRIVITHDFRILLPDFQGKEIRMEPINKAVFILFLRHPEGIAFKDLPDYSRELGFIYQAVRKKKNDIDERMSRSNDMPTPNSSIAMLTNPFNNSINEKCTRIKEAFLEQLHESVAENYYVTGYRAEIKRIKLPVSMIEWE